MKDRAAPHKTWMTTGGLWSEVRRSEWLKEVGDVTREAVDLARALFSGEAAPVSCALDYLSGSTYLKGCATGLQQGMLRTSRSAGTSRGLKSMESKRQTTHWSLPVSDLTDTNRCWPVVDSLGCLCAGRAKAGCPCCLVDSTAAQIRAMTLRNRKLWNGV